MAMSFHLLVRSRLKGAAPEFYGGAGFIPAIGTWPYVLCSTIKNQGSSGPLFQLPLIYAVGIRY